MDFVRIKDVLDNMKKAKVPNAYMAEYDGFGSDWISTSSLACYMKCGIKFFHKYIQRVREPINIRMTAGVGTHKGREENLKQKVESQENLKIDEITDATRDNIKERFDANEYSASTEFKGKSKKEASDIAVDMGVQLVERDYQDFQEVLMPEAVEESMAVRYADLSRIIVGKIDVRTKDYKIIDLKTGKKAFGQSAADTLMGLTTYGLLCSVEHGAQPPEYEIQNVVRTVGGNVNTNVYKTRRNAEDIQRQLLRFASVIKAIDSGIFTPANPGDWWCSPTWCGYYKMCRYGGCKLTGKE